MNLINCVHKGVRRETLDGRRRVKSLKPKENS